MFDDRIFFGNYKTILQMLDFCSLATFDDRRAQPFYKVETNYESKKYEHLIGERW